MKKVTTTNKILDAFFEHQIVETENIKVGGDIIIFEDITAG